MQPCTSPGAQEAQLTLPQLPRYPRKAPRARLALAQMSQGATVCPQQGVPPTDGAATGPILTPQDKAPRDCQPSVFPASSNPLALVSNAGTRTTAAPKSLVPVFPGTALRPLLPNYNCEPITVWGPPHP